MSQEDDVRQALESALGEEVTGFAVVIEGYDNEGYPVEWVIGSMETASELVEMLEQGLSYARDAVARG